MLSREDKSEWLTAAGVLAVVVSPCLVACVYYLALGHSQTALLYAVPAVCCGLLYLGLWRVFGLLNSLEAGLTALIVCILCVILVPVINKLHTKHRANSAVTKGDAHAARSTVTNLPSV